MECIVSNISLYTPIPATLTLRDRKDSQTILLGLFLNYLALQRRSLEFNPELFVLYGFGLIVKRQLSRTVILHTTGLK